MEVFHIIETYQKDGTSNVVRDICRMTDSGTTHTIINLTSFFDAQAVEELQSYKHVNFHSFNYKGDNNYSLRHYWWLFLHKGIMREKLSDVINFISVHDPDIIHFHTNPRELILARYIKNKVRLLFTDHLVRIKRGQYPRLNQMGLLSLYRRLYAPFHLIAVSPAVARMHASFNLTGSGKMTCTIYNAIDTDRFAPEGRDINVTPQIIYIARLEKIKGHEVLLKALGRMTDADFHLTIVGDGTQRKFLAELTASLGLEKKVSFTGMISDPLKYLQKADFAVFPSFIEGLPLSLLEKMSCGLPVICSDIDELKTVIDDGFNGLIFKAGDEEQLYDKIRYLLENPVESKRIGKNARDYVLKNHLLKSFGKYYDQVYLKILHAI